MAYFRDRLAFLDEGSREFLTLLVALGGYCTVSQAKALKIVKKYTRSGSAEDSGAAWIPEEGRGLPSRLSGHQVHDPSSAAGFQ